MMKTNRTGSDSTIKWYPKTKRHPQKIKPFSKPVAKGKVGRPKGTYVCPVCNGGGTVYDAVTKKERPCVACINKQ